MKCLSVFFGAICHCKDVGRSNHYKLKCFYKDYFTHSPFVMTKILRIKNLQIIEIKLIIEVEPVTFLGAINYRFNQNNFRFFKMHQVSEALEVLCKYSF